LREIARVRGEPVWIGARSDDRKTPKPVVAAVAIEDGRPAGQIVLDGARDLEWPLEGFGGSTFFLDDKSRLWLGSDHGEWGGALDWFDLTTGTKHPLANTPLDGVYGIGATRGGPVLTWGGMLHMGLGSADIREAEPRTPRYHQERGFGREPRAQGRPVLPISQLVDESGDGKSIAVFAVDGVFRTEPSFQSWTKLGTLDVQYAPGRPDAVGVYPALRAVHVLGPGHFVLATGLDGYVEFDGGRCITHSLDSEANVRSVRGIRATRDGLLFVGESGAPSFWYRSGRWEPAALDPPLRDVCPDPRDCGEGWSSDWRRVLVGLDGTLFSANEAGASRSLTRWQGGRPQIIVRNGESWGPDIPQAIFMTPEGTFWYAWDVLARLVDGKWQKLSERLENQMEIGWGLRPVNSVGPPWILVSDSHGGMVRLSYDRGFANVRIESIAGRDDVTDALALDDKRILVAGRKGLQLYATDTGTFAKWTGAVPDGGAFRLARDKRGRIWVAGEKLWLLEEDEKRMHAMSPLDIVSGEITALAADPARDDGVVLATWKDEVAFVQAQAGEAGPK
jgi:hypothetical protein